jgi:uncharacterized protein (DUF697 family)
MRVLSSRQLKREGSAMLCREKAREWVHITAAGGGSLAAVPIPGIGTAGLAAMEATLIYWIGRIYGEKVDATAIARIAGSLEIASLGIKVGVMELLNLVPIAGWVAKIPIAVGIIEGIGALAIKHFEDRTPNKEYTVDPDVEAKAPKVEAVAR